MARCFRVAELNRIIKHLSFKARGFAPAAGVLFQPIETGTTRKLST